MLNTFLSAVGGNVAGILNALATLVSGLL